jgi:hypothetical protein
MLAFGAGDSGSNPLGAIRQHFCRFGPGRPLRAWSHRPRTTQPLIRRPPPLDLSPTPNELTLLEGRSSTGLPIFSIQGTPQSRTSVELPDTAKRTMRRQILVCGLPQESAPGRLRRSLRTFALPLRAFRRGPQPNRGKPLPPRGGPLSISTDELGAWNWEANFQFRLPSPRATRAKASAEGPPNFSFRCVPGDQRSVTKKNRFRTLSNSP